MVEVTGSNPVLPTKKDHLQPSCKQSKLVRSLVRFGVGKIIVAFVYWCYRGKVIARRGLQVKHSECTVFTGGNALKTQ